MKRAIVLAIALFVVSAEAKVPGYRGVQRSALKLIRICPPEDCVLVFSGRSGSAVAAYLEALTEQSSVQVPLSDFRYNPFGGEGRFRNLTPEEEEKLFSHFDAFIDRSRLVGKTVMTVDYVQSGLAQMAFTAYLNRWMESRGLKTEATAVPIESWVHARGVQARAREYHVQIGAAIELGLRGDSYLAEGAYDELSAYGSYFLLDATEPPSTIPRKEYRAMVAEISEKQANNPAIVRFKSDGLRARKGFLAKLSELVGRLCSSLLKELVAAE